MPRSNTVLLQPPLASGGETPMTDRMRAAGRRLAEVVDWIEETVLALLLAAMTLVTFGQVVARYVFNSGAVWALELTVFLFAWLVLLGAGYGVRVGAHIGVDFLVRLLPPKLFKASTLLCVLLCLGYAALMFASGWDNVALLLMIGIEAEDLPVPRWIPTLAIPVGFGWLFLRLLIAGIDIALGRRAALTLVHEADKAVQDFRDSDAIGHPTADYPLPARLSRREEG